MKSFPLVLMLTIGIMCASPLFGQSEAEPVVYVVTGTVLDANSGSPLPGVSIRVQGSQRGTYSSRDGRFRLPLPQGTQRVRFSSIGYEPYEQTFSAAADDITVRLTPSAVALGNVEVTADISAEQIIRRAIQRKEENLEKIVTFQGLLYSKFTMEIDGNMFGQIKDADRKLIMETFSRLYFDKPDQQVAVNLLQRRQTANMSSEQNLLTIGNFVSFYDETIELLNTSIPSPLADDALSYYTYTLKRRIPFGDKIIYELEVTPTSSLFPSFTGTLRIVEGTYNLIEAHLAPSESTTIAYVRDLELHQKFEQFPGDIWHPTLLVVTGRGHVNVLTGFGEIDVGINATSIYSDVVLNQPIPDSVFQNRERIVQVAPNADSSRPEFWENNALTALSRREQEIYHHIDSVVANTPPEEGSAADTSFRMGLSPVLSFNRVGSITGGGAVSLGYNPVTLRLEGAYSFGLEQVFGQADLRLRLLNERYATMDVSAGVFSRIAAVPYSTPYSSTLNTVYTALFHSDYNDYLREDGWQAGLFGTLADIYYSFEGRFMRQFCESNTTSHSLFSGGGFRANPPIDQGNYRVLNGTLGWGNSIGTSITISSNSSFDIDGQLIGMIGEEQNSGLAFRSLRSDLRIQMPTFYTGYMPMSLDISIAAGKASEDIPSQFQFILGRRMPVFGMLGHFATAPIGAYGGTEFVSLYAEHNFSDFFWRLFGLPEYEGRGLEFILEGGAARYRYPSSPVYLSTGDNWYGEAGFGIGKIPTFISNVFYLRVDALWGVGPLAKGRFGMTFTLSSPF